MDGFIETIHPVGPARDLMGYLDAVRRVSFHGQLEFDFLLIDGFHVRNAMAVLSSLEDRLNGSPVTEGNTLTPSRQFQMVFAFCSFN